MSCFGSDFLGRCGRRNLHAHEGGINGIQYVISHFDSGCYYVGWQHVGGKQLIPHLMSTIFYFIFCI